MDQDERRVARQRSVAILTSLVAGQPVHAAEVIAEVVDMGEARDLVQALSCITAEMLSRAGPEVSSRVLAQLGQMAAR